MPTGVESYDAARGVYVNEKYWFESKVGGKAGGVKE